MKAGMKRIWIMLAILLVGSVGLPAEVEFKTMSLEQALQRAGIEKKVVFIDFFTTWCMPCKIMDGSTWKDGQVGEWLAKNTVAIRLDGDKERQVVKKYKIAGFPSMLFLKPDGQVLDCMIGVRDAASFLREAAAIFSGEDPYSRAKRILKEEGEESVMARMKYVNRLNGLGRSEEALAALLWCYDKVSTEGKIFIPRAQVIAGLGSLAKSLPAAREALKLRLDKELARLDKETWTMDEVTDVLDMSRYAKSNLSERILLYDKLKGRAERDGKAGELATLFQNELSEARRYAELAALLDPEKAVENCLLEISVKQEWGRNNSDSPMFGTSLMMIAGLISNVCGHYEILLGCGEEAKAASLAEKLLGLDKSASTLNGLAWSGLCSGRSRRWHLELAEKAWNVSEKKDAKILDTYCRLLARFDQMPRAEALVREFQKGSGNEEANRELERCLDEIRRGLPPPRT